MGSRGAKVRRVGERLAPSLEEKPAVPQVADGGPFEVGPEGTSLTVSEQLSYWELFFSL